MANPIGIPGTGAPGAPVQVAAPTPQSTIKLDASGVPINIRQQQGEIQQENNKKNQPVKYVTEDDINKAKELTADDLARARKENPGQPSTTIEMKAREYARKRAEDLRFVMNQQQGFKSSGKEVIGPVLTNPTVTATSRGSVSESTTPPKTTPPKTETKSATVPVKTGNPDVDRAVKKFDTQGTKTEKLENMWDKVLKFFTGNQEGDVTIWDFLEATGRAMAKNDGPSTRTIRREQQREERLAKEAMANQEQTRLSNIEAEKAQQLANQEWQAKQNDLNRGLQWAELNAKREASKLNPIQLGAQTIGGQ